MRGAERYEQRLVSVVPQAILEAPAGNSPSGGGSIA